MTDTTTDQMRITRVFDAPRSLVWRAFTDPDQVARWFGPVGFSAPRDEIQIEPRPGGVEHIVIVKDDDPTERIELESSYTEVIPEELLLGVDGGPDGGNFRIEFHEEAGGKTRLELYAWPVTEEWADEATKGWESSFGKLDRILESGVNG